MRRRLDPVNWLLQFVTGGIFTFLVIYGLFLYAEQEWMWW